MDWEYFVYSILVIVILIMVLFIMLICGAFFLLAKMYDSVQPSKPSEKSDENKNIKSENPLFRKIPNLEPLLSWEPLGNFPTPIHKAEINGKKFWMKREDLSSPLYGGNKVSNIYIFYIS